MRRFAVLLVSAAAVLSGCASQHGSGSPTTTSRTTLSTSASTSPAPTTSRPHAATTTTAPAPAPAPGTVVTTASSQFGTILFDRTGQAVYTFDAETSSKPACYNDCARAWPPVLTTGRPVAAGTVRQSLLGVITRTDGTTQVTYGGRPLYFYAHEGKHQVLCHNVTEFGGRWLAVTATATSAPA